MLDLLVKKTKCGSIFTIKLNPRIKIAPSCHSIPMDFLFCHKKWKAFTVCVICKLLPKIQQREHFSALND